MRSFVWQGRRMSQILYVVYMAIDRIPSSRLPVVKYKTEQFGSASSYSSNKVDVFLVINAALPTDIQSECR
jgi:hypothetical protein